MNIFVTRCPGSFCQPLGYFRISFQGDRKSSTRKSSPVNVKYVLEIGILEVNLLRTFCIFNCAKIVVTECFICSYVEKEHSVCDVHLVAKCHLFKRLKFWKDSGWKRD
jgi:hypothetical protein